MSYPKGESEKPSALTEEIRAKLLKYIEEGSYLDPACLAAGTTRQTLEYWQKLHESGDEKAKAYSDFFASLARARGKAEIESLTRVRNGEPGWQGAGWFLERRYRKRWGKQEKVDVTQTNKSASAVLRVPIKQLHDSTEDSDESAAGAAGDGPGDDG